MKYHRKKRNKPNNAASILKQQKRNRYYQHWLQSEKETPTIVDEGSKNNEKI
jgi:hypothetical protein